MSAGLSARRLSHPSTNVGQRMAVRRWVSSLSQRPMRWERRRSKGIVCAHGVVLGHGDDFIVGPRAGRVFALWRAPQRGTT